MAKQILVNVSWSGKNFSASLDENIPGAIVVTNKNYNALIDDLEDTLDFHIEGMVEDGEKVADWLLKKEYTFKYKLTTAALLQLYSNFTSYKAIAKESGINEQLISHYANDLKKPRPKQKEKIIEGLQRIGRKLMGVREVEIA